MARFYLDENISRNVESALAQNAHDVVHSVDLGNRSRPDPEHLQAAAESARILVTFNRRDFRVLHQFWTALNAWGTLDRRHAGILTSWGDISDEPWAALVHDFVSQRRNLNNEMWEWRPQQQEWERFGW